MPQDQENTVIRRRARRADSAADHAESSAPITPSTPAVSATDGEAPASEARPTHRRGTRAAATQDTSAADTTGEAPAEMTPRPRRTRARAAASQDAEQPITSAPADAPADAPAPTRRARTRRASAASDTSDTSANSSAPEISASDLSAAHTSSAGAGTNETSMSAATAEAAPTRRPRTRRAAETETTMHGAFVPADATTPADAPSHVMAASAEAASSMGTPAAEPGEPSAPRANGRPAWSGRDPRFIRERHERTEGHEHTEGTDQSDEPSAGRPTQRPYGQQRPLRGPGGAGRGPLPYSPGGRDQQRPPTQGYEPPAYNQGQGGYNQQGGYQRQGSYPPRQRGYGQQDGYPQQGGYQQQGGYPPQQGGYPPQQGGYGAYDPYGAPQNGNHQNDQRPRRGYGQQPIYPDQAPGGRGYNPPREPRSPRSYPGGRQMPGYPEPGGRNLPGRRGIAGPHDRRGYGDGHSTQRSRTQRDGGYYGHMPTPPSPAGGRYGYPTRQAPPIISERAVEVDGILWLGGGQGMSPAEVLDPRTLVPLARVNTEEVRRLGLRSGDLIRGRAEDRAGRKQLVIVDARDGVPIEEAGERPSFEQLTATFPTRRIRLEQGPLPISTRVIDLFAPLGFGSRALVVAPPKTGKTTLIREAAEAVLKGYPEAVVMAVLVGERPEEVTDLRARLEPRGGHVYAASFDEETERHAWLVQVAVERAKRVAESGRDAFMVLDSLTRLARAENLATRGQGRTLSGGIDAQALDTGRRAFGAARNLDEGGSLTILATCLVDTGSRQDDVVYEEFKGTGNMELHLSRELSQRRLFPSVDAIKSSTRREETLLTPEELRAATALRRRLADVPPVQATQQILNVLERTPSNAALLQAIEQSGWATTNTR